MKQDLLTVNHTDVKPLIKELEKLAEDNQLLRVDNNRVGFECEKAKKELDRVKTHLKEADRVAERHRGDLIECRATVNRMVEEGKETADADQKRVTYHHNTDL